MSEPTAAPAGETRRTDTEVFAYPPGLDVVTADFARQLERELAVALDRVHANGLGHRTFAKRTEVLEAELAALKRDIARYIEIAGQEASALDAAVLAEREECAALAAMHFIPGHSVAGHSFAEKLANKIRARAAAGKGVPE